MSAAVSGGGRVPSGGLVRRAHGPLGAVGPVGPGGLVGLVGLRVTDDGEGTVTVALDGAHLAQGLVELRRHLPQVLPGGTDTLRIDLRAVDHLSSVGVATLLRVKRVCVARRVHLVLDRATGRGQGLLVRAGLRDVLESAVGR